MQMSNCKEWKEITVVQQVPKLSKKSMDTSRSECVVSWQAKEHCASYKTTEIQQKYEPQDLKVYGSPATMIISINLIRTLHTSECSLELCNLRTF